ncbi:MAG: trypsin-like peptidase domain-containing protein [Ardenticatenaceae bacterium]
MTDYLTDERLTEATCAVLIGGEVMGTGWLVSDEGHLLTAGHVLGIDEPASEVEVRFVGESSRPAQIIAWRYSREEVLDFAVLQLSAPISRRALPISLAKEVAGKFRLCGYGTKLRELAQYTSQGEFSGAMHIDEVLEKHLFRLRSSDLGLQGNSGGAVVSDVLQAAVGIQTEAAKRRMGPERDVVLAMPLYRVAQHWSALEKIALASQLATQERSQQLENPFYKESGHIIGREDELRRILQKIRYNHCSIVGPHGSGKTALLRETVRRLSAEYGWQKNKILFINLLSLHTIKEVKEQLALEMGISTRQLKRQLRQQRLLVLDDAGSIELGRRGLAIRKYLRGLSENNRALKLLVSSNLPLNQIFADDPASASPFYTIDAAPLHLSPLPIHICRALVRQRLQNHPYSVEQFQEQLRHPRHPKRLLDLGAARYEQLRGGLT